MNNHPYHHGNLEEALIETGLSLVDKEGLENVSLRRIAAACGVSHAAPYKHFSSKEDLFAAMQTFVENRFADVLQAAYDQTVEMENKMVSMARSYLSFFNKNPHYFSFFQRQQEDLQINLSKLEQQSNYRPFEVFKNAALDNLSQLPLDDASRTETVIAMWTVVHGLTAISVMNGIQYDGDWNELLQSILEHNLTAGGGHLDHV